jgi:mediator of RNA polymerase II transcription subunit 5
MDRPRRMTTNAIVLARSGKVPWLDFRRQVEETPVRYLQWLWSEACSATALGGLEPCRRLFSFTLASPRLPHVPPLLPIFLHEVLLGLIADLDRQQPQEQNMNTDMLLAVLVSTFTSAQQLEWAMQTLQPGFFYGQSSQSMAKKLGSDLRRSMNSPTATLLLQRLSSSPFAANFPMFTK